MHLWKHKPQLHYVFVFFWLRASFFPSWVQVHHFTRSAHDVDVCVCVEFPGSLSWSADRSLGCSNKSPVPCFDSSFLLGSLSTEFRFWPPWCYRLKLSKFVLDISWCLQKGLVGINPWPMQHHRPIKWPLLSSKRFTMLHQSLVAVQCFTTH